jgi:acylglycerol lipase
MGTAGRATGRLCPRVSLDKTRIQHSEDWFRGRDGTRLYMQAWEPHGPPRAVVLVVHGLFEHSGRYGNLVNCIVPRGFAVYSFDQRGHGRSEGLRGYIRRFSYYVDDLEIFRKLVSERHPAKPMFILGHSVGGTVVADYLPGHQAEFSGCVLSAATTAPGSSVTRSSILMARALSALLPKLGVARIDATAISRDRQVVEAYVNDPLVYRGKIRARLGAELINVIERALPSKVTDIEVPILLIHGSQDRLSNTEGSSRLYAMVKSKDKTLKYYDGFYHELLNEPERARVLADIGDWLENHVRIGEE